MIKLAILTPQNSYENIKKCLKGIECEIKYIFYNNLYSYFPFLYLISEKPDFIWLFFYKFYSPTTSASSTFSVFGSSFSV